MSNIKSSKRKQVVVALVIGFFALLFVTIVVVATTMIIDTRNKDQVEARAKEDTGDDLQNVPSFRTSSKRRHLLQYPFSKNHRQQQQQQHRDDEALFRTTNEKVQWLTNQWQEQQQQQLSTNTKSDLSSFFHQNSNSQQVHVIQIANKRYQQIYQKSSILNQEWTKCTGYQYHLLPFDDDDDDTSSKKGTSCKHTKKVNGIANFFINKINYGDWMIFIDMDAYYQSPNCHELDTMLFNEQNKLQQQQLHLDQSSASLLSSLQKCEVIFHMCSIGINSGILIIQKTFNTIHLINQWLQQQINHSFCLGPGDQWTLQESVLKYYNLSSIDECMKLEKGPKTFSHRGHCSNDKLQEIKRQSEQYYYNNIPSKGRYIEYIKQHDNYTIIPLLGTGTSSNLNIGDATRTSNKSNSVCIFDCLSYQPLQCKDCEYDYIAKKLHPADGTRTCRNDRGQSPLFHHSHNFLIDTAVHYS